MFGIWPCHCIQVEALVVRLRLAAQLSHSDLRTHIISKLDHLHNARSDATVRPHLHDLAVGSRISCLFYPSTDTSARQTALSRQPLKSFHGSSPVVDSAMNTQEIFPFISLWARSNSSDKPTPISTGRFFGGGWRPWGRAARRQGGDREGLEGGDDVCDLDMFVALACDFRRSFAAESRQRPPLPTPSDPCRDRSQTIARKRSQTTEKAKHK